MIVAAGCCNNRMNLLAFVVALVVRHPSTDGRPFEEVMEAVSSNRMDPEGRPVWLVLERPEQPHKPMSQHFVS